MKKTIIFIIIGVVLLVVLWALFCNPKTTTVQQSSVLQDKDITSVATDTLEICSFNIQFLGSFKKRDDAALADILKSYDIVVVQELVAPPYDGVYPDGKSYKGDKEAAEFFDAMSSHGFVYMLSEEDTGTGDKIHQQSTSTEWFVTFFKPNAVSTASDLPSGFLAEDRSNHPDYERVPYAFPFRTRKGAMDFVLISVHLQPGDSPDERDRRAHELASIANWIDANDASEKDFIILGDMNIYDAEELSSVTPAGYLSLNDECRLTNTLSIDASKGEPYDHVMYHTVNTTEIDKDYDLTVINLIDVMKPYWTISEPYPGDPYDHNTFKQYYSDHFPVVFRMITPARDDD
jgi:endonuclease/exonuclease/phosphatase family metal-dependent hydrolase